jgi:head-tail adaptor
MQAKRSLIKQLLYVIKGLGSKEVTMSGFELVKDENGIVIGYKIEIRKDRPKLTIVPKDD